MKATGIVRRIDDLGRVVIPKEIRRTMRIREGDPLEIFTDHEGEVIFKKYSPIGEIGSFAASYAECMQKVSLCPVIVTDRDHVTAWAGISKREAAERRVSQALEDLMEERKSYILDSPSETPLYPVEGIERKAVATFPIIAAGDICGSVSMLMGDTPSIAREWEVKMCRTAAEFFSRQLED